MSVSVATAAKKLLAALSSNKKGRHTLLWVVGVGIVVLILPVILLYGMFGWMSDEQALTLDSNSIYEQLSSEDKAEIEKIDSVNSRIAETLKNKNIDETTQKKAQAIYISKLLGKETAENFYDDYADCFIKSTADKDEYDWISEKFGVDISSEEREYFEKMYID